MPTQGERGRRPDYKIMAKDRDTDEVMTVGAAWLKDNGQIYIKLERFVVLQGGGQFGITAFPTEEAGPYELPNAGDRVAARSRRTTREPDDFPEGDAEPRRRPSRAVRTRSAGSRRTRG